eukprot:scaffold1135_cov216-Pinguiococcus_pyrenoidosus.AAC.5
MQIRLTCEVRLRQVTQPLVDDGVGVRDAQLRVEPDVLLVLRGVDPGVVVPLQLDGEHGEVSVVVGRQERDGRVEVAADAVGRDDVGRREAREALEVQHVQVSLGDELLDLVCILLRQLLGGSFHSREALHPLDFQRVEARDALPRQFVVLLPAGDDPVGLGEAGALAEEGSEAADAHAAPQVPDRGLEKLERAAQHRHDLLGRPHVGLPGRDAGHGLGHVLEGHVWELRMRRVLSIVQRLFVVVDVAQQALEEVVGVFDEAPCQAPHLQVFLHVLGGQVMVAAVAGHFPCVAIAQEAQAALDVGVEVALQRRQLLGGGVLRRREAWLVHDEEQGQADGHGQAAHHLAHVTAHVHRASAEAAGAREVCRGETQRAERRKDSKAAGGFKPLRGCGMARRRSLWIHRSVAVRFSGGLQWNSSGSA